MSKKPTKDSAFYMGQLRARLREAGFVPRDVWILPENSKSLRKIEKMLREPLYSESSMESLMSQVQNWNSKSLYAEMLNQPSVINGAMSVKALVGLTTSIQVTMNEAGELPIFIAVTGEQILVQATLFEATKIRDTAAFNDAVLRSRSLFPLSSIALENINGTNVYVMYGALSAGSLIESVMTEIETLADNVINAVDAFEIYFNKN